MDGFIFSGGEDVYPGVYGQTCHELSHYCHKRDNLEQLLMLEVLKAKKPVLAICRGMQLLLVVNGAKAMIQHLPEYDSENSNLVYKDERKWSHIAHHLELEKNSLLASVISSQSLEMNSIHHQGVLNLGSNHNGLEVVSKVGQVIEVVESKTLPIIGIQGHPEAVIAASKMPENITNLQIQSGAVSCERIFEWLVTQCEKPLIH